MGQNKLVVCLDKARCDHVESFCCHLRTHLESNIARESAPFVNGKGGVMPFANDDMARSMSSVWAPSLPPSSIA